MAIFPLKTTFRLLFRPYRAVAVYGFFLQICCPYGADSVFLLSASIGYSLLKLRKFRNVGSRRLQQFPIPGSSRDFPFGGNRGNLLRKNDSSSFSIPLLPKLRPNKFPYGTITSSIVHAPLLSVCMRLLHFWYLRCRSGTISISCFSFHRRVNVTSFAMTRQYRLPLTYCQLPTLSNI